MTNLAELSVNWNEVTEIGHSPVPPGEYGAKIVKTEVRKTKDGTGQYINIEFALVGQKGLAGKRVFEKINIKNKSEKCVQIGLGQWKSLLKVLNMSPDSVQDTSQIHGQLVGMKVIVEDKNDSYGPSNRVKSFFEFSEELVEKSLTNEVPF